MYENSNSNRAPTLHFGAKPTDWTGFFKAIKACIQSNSWSFLSIWQKGTKSVSDVEHNRRLNKNTHIFQQQQRNNFILFIRFSFIQHIHSCQITIFSLSSFEHFQTWSLRGRKLFNCDLQQWHSAKFCLLFVLYICLSVCCFVKGNVFQKCAHCFV